MGLRTPLYELHVALGAKMIDFGGWDIPLHYGSQVEKHHQVRRDYGVFDVPHITVVNVSGGQATAYLQRLLASGVARLGETSKTPYSAMLNKEGGVVDDLIVYLTENGCRVVVNASTRDKDIIWMQAQAAGSKVDLQGRGDLAMLAIQDLNARVHSPELVSPARVALIRELKPFRSRAEGDRLITRTGHTGEDGLEIILPTAETPGFLNELVGAGISPAGLGVHNTLRLEAELNLYDQDTDGSVSPLVANTSRTVAWEPVAWDSVGRHALKAQKAVGDRPKLVSLVLEGRGVLRAHRVVRVADIGKGEITSGSFSPTLNKSIALAHVPAATGDHAEVEIRGKWYPVRVVQSSFVRHGKPLV